MRISDTINLRMEGTLHPESASQIQFQHRGGGGFFILVTNFFFFIDVLSKLLILLTGNDVPTKKYEGV